MTKVLEIFFRNKWKLSALLLAPIVLSSVIVFFLPRSYQATARLWALRRYEAIGATGPESDLQSYPSVTQATALTEMLQTKSFDLEIAKATDLPKHVGVPLSDTARLNDALYTEISSHVSVTSSGYSLFLVTYSNKDPVLAQQVVQAVIVEYGKESSTNATAEGEHLLATYQGQLKAAKGDAASATQAAAQYLKDHNLTATTAQADPQYQALSTQATQANTLVTTIQSNINTINQQMATLSTGANGLYQTVDAPTVPTKPEARTKSLLLGGAIGLLVGIFASIGYFLVLVRLDESVYTIADLSESSSYPVLLQIPQLPRRSTPWMSPDEDPLLTGKGT